MRITLIVCMILLMSCSKEPESEPKAAVEPTPTDSAAPKPATVETPKVENKKPQKRTVLDRRHFRRLQTVCPNCADPIDKAHFHVHVKKRFYLCGKPECKAEVKRRPGYFVQKMTSEGLVFYREQTMCPLKRDKKILKKLFYDHAGKRTYFCCKECLEAFQVNPDFFMKQLEDDGVILETL